MSQMDPLREFTPTPKKKGTPEKADNVPQVAIPADGLVALRSFFEDDAISDIYSKENLGSGSYTVSGLPCHGGYDDLDREDSEDR